MEIKNYKEEAIKIIESLSIDKKLKEIIIGCIEISYKEGFKHGMEHASEIQIRTLDMLFPIGGQIWNR